MTIAGCAGRTPAPETPAIIAGSVCSGVRGLDRSTLDPSGAHARATQPELAAWITEPEDAKAAQELSVIELATGRLRWRKALRATARPQILEDLVVTTTADRQLVAFDLASGTERFRRALDRPFWIGAAQSGQTVVITTGASSWDPRERGSSLIALDAESGSERWSREVPYALTRPAVAGGRVLVVADRADLLVLDLESGAEMGCGALGGNTVEWVESDGAAVWFGASEARQLGPDARALPATLVLPRSDLPGRPFPHESSYLPQPATRSAHGRVAVIAPLHTSASGPALTQAGFYFVFYRDVFAFEPDGRLAWVQLMSADIARAEASSAGLWVLTEAGELALLAGDTGEARTRRTLGSRVASADLRTGRASPPAPRAEEPTAASQPTAAGHAGPEPPPPAADLQAPLERLAQDTDARLLPARLFAVDELARIETSSATADLLEVYSAPNTPRGLRDRIEKRLRERKLGAEILVEALDQHEDFLEETPAPPLRAIVPGLVTQREKRAVPALVDHLFDPDTPRSDLGMLVSAIDALGGESAREPLLRFFRMYRADSALHEDADALARAASALLAREDAGTRALLETTRDSALTAPLLREELAALLAPPPPEPASEPSAEPAVAAAPQPAPVVDLREVLDAARPAFEPCVRDAQARAPKLAAIRLWFVAQPDGVARDVHARPNDRALQACLGTKLAELRLPSERKQLVSYRIVVQPKITAPPPERTPQTREAAEFWSAAERRAPKPAAKPKAPPWWLDKNPLFVAIDAAPRPTPLLAPQSGAARTKAEPSGAARPETAPDAPDAPAPAEDAWWIPAQPAN